MRATSDSVSRTCCCDGSEIGRPGDPGGGSGDQPVERRAEQHDEARAHAAHGDRRRTVGEARQRAAVLRPAGGGAGREAQRLGRHAAAGERRQASRVGAAGSLTPASFSAGVDMPSTTTTPPPFANVSRRVLAAAATPRPHHERVRQRGVGGRHAVGGTPAPVSHASAGPALPPVAAYTAAAEVPPVR